MLIVIGSLFDPSAEFCAYRLRAPKGLRLTARVGLGRCLLITLSLASIISCGGYEYWAKPVVQAVARPASLAESILPNQVKRKAALGVEEQNSGNISVPGVFQSDDHSPESEQYHDIPASFFSCMPLRC